LEDNNQINIRNEEIYQEETDQEENEFIRSRTTDLLNKYSSENKRELVHCVATLFQRSL